MDLPNLGDNILLQTQTALQNGLETAFSGKKYIPSTSVPSSSETNVPLTRGWTEGNCPQPGPLVTPFCHPMGWGSRGWLCWRCWCVSPGFCHLPPRPALSPALGTGAGRRQINAGEEQNRSTLVWEKAAFPHPLILFLPLKIQRGLFQFLLLSFQFSFYFAFQTGVIPASCPIALEQPRPHLHLPLCPAALSLPAPCETPAAAGLLNPSFPQKAAPNSPHTPTVGFFPAPRGWYRLGSR